MTIQKFIRDNKKVYNTCPKPTVQCLIFNASIIDYHGCVNDLLTYSNFEQVADHKPSTPLADYLSGTPVIMIKPTQSNFEEFKQAVNSECGRDRFYLKFQPQLENTHLLWKGKYHCMADLLFDWLGFSCFVYVELDRD